MATEEGYSSSEDEVSCLIIIIIRIDYSEGYYDNDMFMSF